MATCQRIYNEVEPIYTSSQDPVFRDLKHLLAGLTKLGPERRRLITKLTFNYELDMLARFSTATHAFKLLYESTELKYLSITTCEHQLLRKPKLGLKSLLELRGIEKLKIQPGHVSYFPNGPDPQTMAAHRDFERQVAVLKEPYNELALERRAAAGIIKDTKARVFSFPVKNLHVEDGTSVLAE
ncbi:MAG: hypothetical protein Q9218_003355 [Villophora microphyllina]